MRLTELDPRWLLDGDRKVGFVFRCPTNPAWYQTCFFEAGRKTLTCDRPECNEADVWACPHSQLGLVEAAGLDSDHVQACEPHCAWTVHGPLDFEVLTVTPSLDGSKGGLWHGFIRNGEIA